MNLDDCGKEVIIPRDIGHGYSIKKKVIMVIQGPRGTMRLFESPMRQTDRSYPVRNASGSIVDWITTYKPSARETRQRRAIRNFMKFNKEK